MSSRCGCVASVAWVITIVLLVALTAWVENVTDTRELHLWFRIAFGSVILWFIFGPAWSVVFLRREISRE